MIAKSTVLGLLSIAISFAAIGIALLAERKRRHTERRLSRLDADREVAREFRGYRDRWSR